MALFRKTLTALPVLMIAIFAYALFAAAPKALAFSGPGSGTGGDPYVITTCGQLQEIASTTGLVYRLGSDVDCGTYGNFPLIPVFRGTLDGAGHAIENLTMDSSSTITSIFGASEGAVFENLTVTNENVSSTGAGVGGLVGLDLGSTFDDVAMTSSTLSTSYNGQVYMGSIAAAYDGIGVTSTIVDSFANTTLNDASGTLIGGLIGAALNPEGLSITITRSYYAGAINGDGTGGGLIGYLNNSGSNPATVSITNSFAAATNAIGGLIGDVDMTSGITLSNDFFDAMGKGTTSEACVYNNNIPGCTAINTDVAPDDSYFFSTSSTAPFTAWDFANTWQVTDQYPVLLETPGELSVATSSFSELNAITAGSSVTKDFFTVSNAGTSSSLLSWSASSTEPWLTFATASGTTLGGDSVPLHTTVDATSLSAGSYNATATIMAAGDAGGSPMIIPLAITVVAAPPAAPPPSMVVDVPAGYAPEGYFTEPTPTSTPAPTSTPVETMITPSSSVSLPLGVGGPALCSGTANSAITSLTFPRDLAPGMTNANVRELQQALNYLGFNIASSGPGSLGNETDYYGTLTEDAVKAFQKAKGIVAGGAPETTGFGLFGPRTREVLGAALKTCAQ